MPLPTSMPRLCVRIADHARRRAGLLYLPRACVLIAFTLQRLSTSMSPARPDVTSAFFFLSLTWLVRFVREVSLADTSVLATFSSCLHTPRAYRVGGAALQVEGLASHTDTLVSCEGTLKSVNKTEPSVCLCMHMVHVMSSTISG